jgi:hypothetical protein
MRVLEVLFRGSGWCNGRIWAMHDIVDAFDLLEAKRSRDPGVIFNVVRRRIGEDCDVATAMPDREPRRITQRRRVD